MQHSRAITRKSASNLAPAFILLPRPKRDAMSALYAFCREVDDVADDETVPAEKRRAQLAGWRADVKRACENQPPEFPVNRELQPVIKNFIFRLNCSTNSSKAAKWIWTPGVMKISSSSNCIVIALRPSSGF
jgi:phytoene/squalene synthetase